MSRVADARSKSGSGGLDGFPADPRPPALDVLDVPVPWDVGESADDPQAQPAAGPRLVTSTPRVQRADFVELVRRVFRPGSDEPTARTVTFVPIGASGMRRVGLEVAQTLAGFSAGTICVVDASFGAAALHEAAGVPAGAGLCDALLASRPPSQLAVSLGRQVWLIPSGHEICAAPGWFPQAFERAVRQLAGRFDFVIVQAPPVEHDGAMPTLLTVAPATDGIVLVLDMDRTRRDVAENLVARLRANGVSILGAVVHNGAV